MQAVENHRWKRCIKDAYQLIAFQPKCTALCVYIVLLPVVNDLRGRKLFHLVHRAVWRDQTSRSMTWDGPTSAPTFAGGKGGVVTSKNHARKPSHGTSKGHVPSQNAPLKAHPSSMLACSATVQSKSLNASLLFSFCRASLSAEGKSL